MGVSGSGKTLIGAAFAHALSIDFVEGDEFHPADNVERMSSGISLTDENRAEWLRLLAARLGKAKDSGKGLVMSCSALKRSYRDILRGAAPGLRFVFLQGERDLIAERLAARRGHFMPPSLLDSQLDILEAPLPDEDAWVCDVRQSPTDLVDALVARASA
jgi:gluconokinase